MPRPVPAKVRLTLKLRFVVVEHGNVGGAAPPPHPPRPYAGVEGPNAAAGSRRGIHLGPPSVWDYGVQ